MHVPTGYLLVHSPRLSVWCVTLLFVFLTSRVHAAQVFDIPDGDVAALIAAIEEAVDGDVLISRKTASTR